ncbi:MAG: TerB family tellurite resistance protein [Polyangiaceae bacterium]
MSLFMASMQVDFSEYDGARLRAAIEQTLTRASEHLPTSAKLKQGAEVTLKDPEAETAKFFQAVLEVSYLVASADGFADEERSALAQLLEGVTQAAVDHDTLELHFRDLDDACAMLGRRERMRRAVEDFSDEAARHQALCFAAIVAMADGKLAEPEAAALGELGHHLGCSPDQVAALTQQMAQTIRAALA